MTKEIPLCGHESERLHGFEPCPRDPGHGGEHVYWRQSIEPGKKRGRNGVWLVEGDGTVLMHADFMGPITAEEVQALLWLQDAVHKKFQEET